MIQLLSEATIDQIAAGEVVERPASAVKELCENSIDAGATKITVEIKEGGIGLIRVTDNGCGIKKEELPTAFLRHATSKITNIKDLESLSTLGFRGEALSSISAVSQIEVITKQAGCDTASRYTQSGTDKYELSDTAAPDGTTFMARNLFFNTPVRKKFLKSPQTEGSYVGEVLEHLALSHPEIAFTFINRGKTAIETSGKGDLKEVIYRLYGMDTVRELIRIEAPSLTGYIAKPVLSKSNRSYEIFFVNGRYVKSTLLSKAVEEAVKPYMMQHRFPFCIISINLEGAAVDANVHPQKLEVRFSDNDLIFRYVKDVISDRLKKTEMIPSVTLTDKVYKNSAAVISTAAKESDNVKNVSDTGSGSDLAVASKEPDNEVIVSDKGCDSALPITEKEPDNEVIVSDKGCDSALPITEKEPDNDLPGKQLDFFEEKLLTKTARQEYRIVGQIFETYWIIEYRGEALIIDQHAAHEKVLYEKFMKEYKTRKIYSQNLMPPLIVSLDTRQTEVLKANMDSFKETGFEIEEFGGREYALYAVPQMLKGLTSKELFLSILDSLVENEGRRLSNELICDKIATMSCKAAVKGNNRISTMEMEDLLDYMLELENPYNCPHGRPTMISMTKYELEKKFKRIV